MFIEDLCGWTIEMTSRWLQRSQLFWDMDMADDFPCLIRIAVPKDSWLTCNRNSLTYDVVALFPPCMNSAGINAKHKDFFR